MSRLEVIERAPRSRCGSGARPLLRLSQLPNSLFAVSAISLPLEACAVQFEGAGLALSLTAGDGGGAVGAATGDFIEGHLALEAIWKADDDHAEVHQVGDHREERRSRPPCCVAVEVNAADLPFKAPRAHRPPAWSRKLAICEGIRPKRVGVPTMIASYSGSSAMVATGAA